MPSSDGYVKLRTVMIFITTIHAPLSATEVSARLGRLIEDRTGLPRRPFGAWVPRDTSAVFTGTRRDESFKVVRIIQYRNAFLPVIRGRVRQVDTGSDVRLVMMLHPLVAAFMVIWCAGLVLGVARSLAESRAPGLAIFPLLVCLFGIVVTAIGFFPEARTAARLIRESLAG